jgi:hypothetical protein
LKSFLKALSISTRTALVALLVAAGSLASASSSTVGRAPRKRSREKSRGMSTTNCTSPRASARRASSSLESSRTKSKYELLRIAESSVRPCGPRSASSTAAGRCLGSELIA